MTLRPVTAAASLLFLLAITCTQTEASTTAVSNLGNPHPDPTNPYSFSLVATSFTIGPAPSALSSVTIQVANVDPVYPDTYAVAIWSDAAGLPGAPLESYPGQSANKSTALFTYTSPAGLPLAPNTTYWTVLTHSGTPAEGGSWYTTSSTAQSSDFGWTIGDFALVQWHVGDTLTWGTYGTSPNAGLFSIDATILPEPSTLALTTLPALALLPRRHRRRHSPRHVC